MTHSPTPDGEHVEVDPVDRLREAWCHENATWGDDGSAEFERVLAEIKVEAVAEYKAEHVSAAEVRAAALVAFPGVDWRDPSVIYDDALTAYASRNIATTSKLRAAAEQETDRCMLAQNKAMIDARRILEAARGAR